MERSALDRWKIPSPMGVSTLGGWLGELESISCSAQGRVRAIIFCLWILSCLQGDPGVTETVGCLFLPEPVMRCLPEAFGSPLPTWDFLNSTY